MSRLDPQVTVACQRPSRDYVTPEHRLPSRDFADMEMIMPAALYTVSKSVHLWRKCHNTQGEVTSHNVWSNVRYFVITTLYIAWS